MVVRGVIFDLFHTLTGRESDWSDLPWTADVLGIDRARWNRLLTERSRWRLAGEERDPFTILATLARKAVPEIPEARVHAALRVRIQRFRDALSRIPPENVETLKRLRSAGFRLGLISNADVMEIAPWTGCPLSGLFDVEVFSCEVGAVKPERAIYEHCLKALELPAGDCLFVGDGGSGELVGAREVGMTPVFLSGVMAELWPDQIALRMAECVHHIRAIPEVLSIVGIQATTAMVRGAQQ